MKQSYFSFWMNPGAVLWLIILVLAAWGQAGPLTGQIRERILYSALRPTNMDLYLYDSPAAEPRRLTDHPALDYNPVSSPDGGWVVFCSDLTVKLWRTPRPFQPMASGWPLSAPVTAMPTFS